MKHKSTSSKRSFLVWGVGAAVVVLAFWGIVAAVRSPKEQPVSILPGSISSADHIRGSAEAKTVLVEYGDYQCPACSAYAPLVDKVVNEYGDRIAFVYRQFPLTQIHKNAMLAAEAAEAAAKQGKFWEMHEMLFDHQDEWENSRDAETLFLSYARQTGLSEEAFKKDLRSDEVRKKVEADRKSGIEAGVQGTPTFFLNGKSIVNPQSEEMFRSIINQALAG